MTRANIRVSVNGRRRVEPGLDESTRPPVTSRGARMLALAHHVERLIEDGVVADYAAVARQLGLTRARMTQLAKLVLLAPEVQEAVLTGAVPATERSLRDLVAEPEWTSQAALLTTLTPDPS